MKNIVALFLLIFISYNFGYSQLNTIDSFEIKLSEIPTEYISHDKLECKSLQSSLLFESPDMYSFILGNVIEKRFQTFEYEATKGSILYFEFDKEAEKGKGFIESLLWGAKESNEAHPEIVITKGNVLIVFSFPYQSEIGITLSEIINDKLKDL